MDYPSPDALAAFAASLGAMPTQPTSASADPTVYRPSEEDSKLIDDTNTKYRRWRQDRQPHEPQWYLNNAFFSNQHYVEFDDQTARIKKIEAKPERVRLKLNRLQAKIRARIAKFLKNRPKPIVIPATSEYQDYLRARGTQRMLDFQWRRLGLEAKLKTALYSAKDCGKSFMWLHWDPTKKARIMDRDPATGAATYREAVLGDIMVENGSAFQVLVADPGIESIGLQPEIMRITVRPVADVKKQFQAIQAFVVGDSTDESLFLYERQIASLTPQGIGLGQIQDPKKNSGSKKFCTVKEHFIRPCADYPQGHYRVIVGEILAEKRDELPYGFWDMDQNPYPVIEFTDMAVGGRFWSPALTEFLIDLQREYNLLRSKIAENARWMAYPKLIAAKQHGLPKNAWTANPGELIEYASYPNINPPQVVTPPTINPDMWRLLDLIQKEFDDISQIFPVSEGSRGGTTSGFQANLLQEASDTVHGPDLRAHELALEDLYRKIRRMTRDGYEVPRLLAVSSPSFSAEIFEFSSEMVDEFADIVVEIGSGLPFFKAARQETVMQLYNSGLLGDIKDPDVRRRALATLELGSLEEVFDASKTDENQARFENTQMGTGQPTPDPEFWENHKVHYNAHTDWLKSPEGRSAPPTVRMMVIRHTVLHGRFINPQSALQIAFESGLQDPAVIQRIQAMLPQPIPGPSGPGAPAPGAPSGPAGGPQPGPGGPPQGTPPGAAPATPAVTRQITPA